MAQVTYTSDFDNLLAARVLPSFNTRYFSLRPFGLPTNQASLAFRGAGEARFLFNEQEYVGEHTLWMYTPEDPVPILPNVAYNISLKLYRTELAYFRFSIAPGKVYSTSLSARVLSDNEDHSVAILYGSQRYPIPGGSTSWYSTLSVSASSGTSTDTINHCAEDRTNGNNAIYFSFTARDTATPSTATFDQLANGTLQVALEFQITRTEITPDPLNQNQEITPTTPSVFSASGIAAIAPGSVLNAYSPGGGSTSFVIGPANQLGLSSVDNCAPGSPLFQSTATAAGESIFACELGTADAPVIQVAAGSFKFNVSDPIIFNGNPLIITPTAARRAFQVRVNESLSLPAVIRVTPDSSGIIGTHTMKVKHLSSDCRENLDVAGWEFESTNPAYVTILCPNYGFVFEFPIGSNGSVMLESIDNPNIEPLTLSTNPTNATFALNAGQTKVIAVSVPSGETWSILFSETNVSASRGSPRVFWGSCLSGIKGNTCTASPITSGGAFLVIPAAEEAQSVTVAFGNSAVTSLQTCVPVSIGPICSGRISSSLVWPVGFDMNTVESAVQQDIFAFNVLYPDQNTSSSCYNSWLDLSCSAAVPFCVGEAQQPSPGYFNAACFSKCRIALYAGGCTGSQTETLCSKYDSCGQATSLDFQLYGSPVGQPFHISAFSNQTMPSSSTAPVAVSAPGNANAKTPQGTSGVARIGCPSDLLSAVIICYMILLFM
eukprot:TRINITY_DN3398_c0_g1_i1.p1 TRINITY_DN3398_c0_g1~~TRINITY_DN3398_c0_g1_i1.p1  ORF type:complete len:718 (+),score=82.59 TRINITY_DN3398_c0_g1_i1:743-2896(+)